MTGILDDNTIPTALDTQTIIITDTVGLTKTYKFLSGGGKSTGDIDGGSVVIQLSGEDTKEGLVDNIKQGIESANGHAGSITVTRNGAVITLTQPIVGTTGNTTIVFSAGIDTSTELSKTDFAGGISEYAGTGSKATAGSETAATLRTGGTTRSRTKIWPGSQKRYGSKRAASRSFSTGRNSHGEIIIYASLVKRKSNEEKETD